MWRGLLSPPDDDRNDLLERMADAERIAPRYRRPQSNDEANKDNEDSDVKQVRPPLPPRRSQPVILGEAFLPHGRPARRKRGLPACSPERSLHERRCGGGEIDARDVGPACEYAHILLQRPLLNRGA